MATEPTPAPGPSGAAAASGSNLGSQIIDGVHRVEAFIGRHPFALAVGVGLGLFVLFWLLLTPAFNTNDDAHLMWIANGTFFGEPQEHLLISTVIVGRALTFLYDLAPGVGWYPYYLYLVHIVAFVTVLYVTFADKRFRLIPHGFATLGFFVLFYLWTWMNLQFTSASLLLGFAAVLLYAVRGPVASTPIWVMVVAGAMLGFSAWVRMESWQGVVFLSIPAVLFTWRRVPWRRFVVFGGVMAMVFFFSLAFENLYYVGNEDWQEYREFNQTRGDLHATPRLVGLNSNRELLDEIGWSRNDLTAFRSWIFIDENVYTTEALDGIRQETQFATNDISEGFQELRDDRWFEVRMVFLLGLFVFAVIEGGWRRRALAVLTVVWTLAGFSYLIAFVRLPARVAVPMLAFVGLTFLLMPWERYVPWQRPRPDWYRYLRYAGATALVLAVVVVTPRALNWTRDASAAFEERGPGLNGLVTGLYESDPDGIFVTLGPALRSQRIDVKDPNLAVPINMLHLGWQARSPMWVDQKNEYGIGDLYEAIALRDDVYFTVKTGETPATLYRRYMEEHYGWTGQLRPAGRFGFGGETTAYDLYVDYGYAADGTALVESLPDGTNRIVVIDETVAVGTLEEVPDFAAGGQLTGWAYDPVTGQPADLIVIMEGDGLRHMLVPHQRRDEIAQADGLDVTTRFGFGLNLAGTSNQPSDVRVFAVFGDTAVELVE